MAVLPEPGAAYAQQQQFLSNATSLSDRYWGLESALSERIDAIADGKTILPGDAARQVATGARRARHRKRILTIYGPTSQQVETPDPARGLEARATIRALARSAGAFEILLLLAVASGISQTTIAGRLFMSPAAVRQRISRARRANNHLRD